MRHTVLFLSLLLLAPLADLVAQEAPSLAPGARVRVSVRQQDRQTGTLVALNADTLLMKVKERSIPLAVPLASVTRLDVSRGQKSKIDEYAVLGLIMGAGSGAVLGAFLGETLCFGDDDDGPCLGRGTSAAIGGVGLGFIGFILGTTAGAVSRVDRWEEVPLEKIRWSISPQRHGGIRLAAAFKF